MGINTDGAKILVVDDDMRNRMLLKRLLTDEGYNHEEAKDGASAISKVRSYMPDLILLDVMMPGMSGFEVAQHLKSDTATADIPIIMVTALEDQASRERGLAVGVEEFISKPVKPNEIQIRVRNLLRLKLAMDMVKENNNTLEQEVRRRTKELVGSFEDGIYVLMRAAEYRDDEGGAHVRRISYYTKTLAAALGKDQFFCNTIALASMLHDVGKVGVADHIIQKSSALDASEWKKMQMHTVIGAKILSGSNSPYIRMGKIIALYHHECWDGSGYPQGLQGEKTPLPARIMKICDVYDALRSQRHHKEAFDHTTAVDIIRYGDDRIKPAHFDPRVHAAFLQIANELEEIFANIKTADPL
ncbi:response regulator [Ghiorsea bivora]|uniref:response regulator n=1 Tax=Ghiorsea bivora TaxID=1485545 RepID=UPI000570F2EB|nr:HD domain-containing phosphohydrolase [Ghiorsea bivora]